MADGKIPSKLNVNISCFITMERLDGWFGNQPVGKLWVGIPAQPGSMNEFDSMSPGGKKFIIACDFTWFVASFFSPPHFGITQQDAIYFTDADATARCCLGYPSLSGSNILVSRNILVSILRNDTHQSLRISSGSNEQYSTRICADIWQ